MDNETKEYMEGISNIHEAVKDLQKEGFDKDDIIRYVKEA